MSDLQTFTVERTFLVPIYQQDTVQAASAEDAMRQLLDEDDWERQETDFDSSRAAYITGLWSGDEAYEAGTDLPIPPEFRDVSQELAGQLEAEDIVMIRDALEILSPDSLRGQAQRERLLGMLTID